MHRFTVDPQNSYGNGIRSCGSPRTDVATMNALLLAERMARVQTDGDLGILRDFTSGRSTDADRYPGADNPDEDEQAKAKGKAMRRIPEDSKIRRAGHDPEEVTCGCQMKSIKADERGLSDRPRARRRGPGRLS